MKLIELLTEASTNVKLLQPKDFEQFDTLMNVNRTRFEKGGLSQLPETEQSFNRWAAEKSVYGIWSVGSLIGFIGMEFVSKFDGTGIWYAIDKAHEGQGLMKSSIKTAMADFSARASKPVSWVLHAFPKNNRSLGLATALGFERDEKSDYVKRASGRGGKQMHGYRVRTPTKLT